MKKIFLLILIAIAFAPFAAKAQEYTLLEPLPCIAGTSTDNTCDPDNTTKTINLNDYIGYVFKFSIALAAFLAVIMIIIGGFQYMTSETPFSKSDGKEKIWNAVTGLLMVLASYLILATIDPRLVEIDTNIKPIEICKDKTDVDCIDTSGVDKFRRDLAADLKNLSIETSQKITQLDAAKQQKQTRINELKAKGIDLSTEEYTELKKLEGEVVTLTAQRKEIVAQSDGISSFRTAINNIYSPDENSAANLKQYTAPQIENRLVNGKYPTNSPNTIQNQFNLQINEIIEKNSDFETAKKLGQQRDFLIAEVREEEKLAKDLAGKQKNILTPKFNSSGYQIGFEDAYGQQLATRKDTYTKNMADPQKAAASGLSQAEYDKIMQARINQIDIVLNPPKQ